MRNYKFISLIFIVGFIFYGCQKDDVQQNVCFEIAGDDCSHLCENERMAFLSGNTETGTCVMSIFLSDCPHQFILDGQQVDEVGWLEHWYNNPLLDSVVASSFLVHESMHSISANVSQPAEESFILLDCENSWIVSNTETFPSNEIAIEIPDENKTLRFNTYIESSHNLQFKGIYGLLEEFAAYYQGSKTILETGRSLNLIENPSKAKIYSNNSVIPYFEFKYWILTYLIHAESTHPNIFDSILNNENFAESFNSLDENYLNVVNQFINLHDPASDLSEISFRNVLEILESQDYLSMMDRLK